MFCDSECKYSEKQMMKQSVFSLMSYFVVFYLGLGPGVAMAKRISVLPQRPFLLYASGNIGIASSEADKLSGASYTKNMRTPLVGVLGFGGYPTPWLWVGARYEYWFAARELSIAGAPQKDTLHLQLVGPEIGFVKANPRVAYIFSMGGLYPLEQRVDSSSQAKFSRGTPFWNYQAKASMELKINSRLDFHLEGGYRWLNLKNLSSGTTAFLPEGRDFNLSGPFVGMGLGFMF